MAKLAVGPRAKVDIWAVLRAQMQDCLNAHDCHFKGQSWDGLGRYVWCVRSMVNRCGNRSLQFRQNVFNRAELRRTGDQSVYQVTGKRR